MLNKSPFKIKLFIQEVHVFLLCIYEQPWLKKNSPTKHVEVCVRMSEMTTNKGPRNIVQIAHHITIVLSDPQTSFPPQQLFPITTQTQHPLQKDQVPDCCHSQRHKLQSKKTSNEKNHKRRYVIKLSGGIKFRERNTRKIGKGIDDKVFISFFLYQLFWFRDVGSRSISFSVRSFSGSRDMEWNEFFFSVLMLYKTMRSLLIHSLIKPKK